MVHRDFFMMYRTFSSLKKIIFTVFILFIASSLKAQDTTYEWKSFFYESYYLGFKKQIPLRSHWFALSMSKNVVDLQELSYGLDAILAMYEATDSSSYLDDAIVITDNVIDSSQPSDQIQGNLSGFKDNFRTWIERSPSEPSIYYKETVLSEIYFFQYVTRLLKDIDKNNGLMKDRHYRNFYDETLRFVETNIWDKWQTRGRRINNSNAYLLLGRTHMASHWAYIAAELSFLTIDEARKSKYLDFVNLYNRELENNFHRYGSYISWSQTWGGANQIPGAIQDVSHANLVVSYIVEAYDLGLWTDSDVIQRLIKTVKDILWDPQNCLFRDNIDGTMFPIGYKGSVGSFQSDGFVKLTRYDKSLFSIYEKFVSCSKYLTAWMQEGQLFANLALSRKLFNAK